MACQNAHARPATVSAAVDGCGTFDLGRGAAFSPLPSAVRVSLDGRYEVAYAPGVFDAMHAFYAAATGWDRTLARYPCDAILVRTGSATAGLLVDHSGWRRVYADAYEIHARTALHLPLRDRRGQHLECRFP